MTCLLCGHKLAIFRRLSLGDFCCQEHRALFLREQSDQGLARLIESKGESRVQAESRIQAPPPTTSQPLSRSVATRVYARFLDDELKARSNGGSYVSHGPLAQSRVINPEAPQKSFSRLAAALPVDFNASASGSMAAVGHDITALRMRLPAALTPVWNGGEHTLLAPAGLILPWSSKAGSHNSFSLSTLVAAAWAQSGNSKPVGGRPGPAGSIHFAWPANQNRIELMPPTGVTTPAAAAFAPVATPEIKPMQVRMTLPSVAPHRQQLAMPAPASTGDSGDGLATKAKQPKRRFLAALFAPSSRPAKVRPRPRNAYREEVFSYNEPAPTVPPTSAGWQAMFAGLTPSAAAASSVFAVLFLFSAIGIYVFAPAALSDRSPSFRWSNLRSAIRDRAVLRLEDDFTTGLNRWIGPAGWSRDWSYDQAGFLRPGKLGFLEQSMKLKNYRMEFMGQIERKSLGWTFRALDDRNYYVAKLTIAKPGPLPLVDLIHYPVTDGKEGPRVRVTLPFSVRNDTLYQIEMNIKGDTFRASVNGHVVDSWTDKVLRAGGVGFFSGQGEASRVRWIRVSDKDDVIGRVCSYLSARAEFHSGETLSASYYTLLRHPGSLSDF